MSTDTENIDFSRELRNGVIIFDGAMGTELYKRHIFTNRCFDELNLTDPSLIQSIHEEYLNAGAEVLTTNTFGANPSSLGKYGLSDKTESINAAGVKIARGAIQAVLGTEGSGRHVWIAGSVGPVPSEESAVLGLERQITSLLDSGVDFILFETQPGLQALKNCASAVDSYQKKRGKTVPFILSFMISDHGCTVEGQPASSVITQYPHSAPSPLAWGLNCGQGPDGMLDPTEQALAALEQMSEEGKRPLPLIVQPNAGIPRNVENRYIYMSSPEYFTTYAMRYVNLGASGVGGCCGIAPEHIREMSKSVKPLAGARISSTERIKKIHASVELTAATPLEQRSRLAWRLTHQQWVTSVELVPPRGYDLKATVEKCKRLYRRGIDCINIPDGPRASSRISPLITAERIQREAQIEVILHFCCRDRNLIGMQADMLACAACDLHNILFITGDPPKLGEYPDATGVFDTDSIGAVTIQNRLNQGVDLGGQRLEPSTHAVMGVGLDPTALDKNREIDRFFQKVEAGANFAITQPVFDVEMLVNFLDKVKECRIPILAGIWPLASYRNASFMQNEVPGVVVPDSMMERMRAAYTREEQLAEGIKIARESIQAVRPYVSGVQVSAPFGNVDTALEVLS